MTRELSESRKQFIAAVESALKRPLTSEELRAVRSFDEPVVEMVVNEFNADQMLAILDDVVRSDSPVRFLENLAETPGSLLEARNNLLNFHKRTSRPCLEQLDFEAAEEQFSRWFLQLLHATPPSPDLQALKFGLYEADGACRIYVVGTKAYDPDQPNWTCANDWGSADAATPGGVGAGIWAQLKESGAQPWVAAQAIAIILIQTFFSRHETEFKRIAGLSNVHVLTGFDDGDLYPVRTAISP